MTQQQPDPDDTAGRELYRAAAEAEARASVTPARVVQLVDLCPGDGRPCYVGRGTDDAHHRCGTVQCGQPMNRRKAP